MWKIWEKRKLDLVREVIEDPIKSKDSLWDRTYFGFFRTVSHEVVCFFEFMLPIPYKFSTHGCVVFQFIVFDSHFGFIQDWYDGPQRSLGLGPLFRINW